METLTQNQSDSLKAHHAQNIKLLADEKWIATCPKRKPAVTRHQRSIEKRLGINLSK